MLAERGKRVAMLVSGDPFWFGAGGSIVGALDPSEWRSLPAPSTFSLVANALGWRLEEVTCHGLHAAPLAQLRAALRPKGRMICLLRDGDAPAALARFLCEQGAGTAQMHVAERLGGSDARLRAVQADGYDLTDVQAPVAVGVDLPDGIGLPRAPGLPDDSFASDGQITKAPVRALTLSALAPGKATCCGTSAQAAARSRSNSASPVVAPSPLSSTRRGGKHHPQHRRFRPERPDAGHPWPRAGGLGGASLA